MPDLKITQLTADTTPEGADLLTIVSSPFGAGSNKKMTLSDFMQNQTIDWKTTGGFAFGGDAVLSSTRVFDISDTIVTFPAGSYGLVSNIALNPATNIGTGSESFVGQGFYTNVQSGNDKDILFANLSAFESAFSHDGTGDVSNFIAVFGQAYNTSTGNVTFEQVGGYFISYNFGNGSITGTAPKAGNFACAVGTGNFGTGTIERNYNFYAETPLNSGGGTISKNWGLYLEDQEIGGESWAIQTTGGVVEFGAVTGKRSHLTMTEDDVTQPFSFLSSTHTYLEFSSLTSTGGAVIRGTCANTAAVSPLSLFGFFGLTNPDDSTPGITLTSSKWTGVASNLAALGSAETVLLVRTFNTNLITTFGNGDTNFIGKITTTATNPAGGSGTGIAVTPTLGIMNGSDNYDAIKVSITNANHTGAGNTIQGITIDGITFDGDATASAIIVGSGGWNYGMILPNSVGMLLGTIGGNRGEIVFDGTNLNFSSTGVNVFDGEVQTTSNVVIGTTAAGTSANKVLALSNSATAPSDSVDLVQLYAVDISAGNATLGLFTETAVAADIGLASTNSLTVNINGTNYKIPLVTA